MLKISHVGATHHANNSLESTTLSKQAVKDKREISFLFTLSK